MKRIARWSTIFLLLCSIIWVGTAPAAMIVQNNMSALNTLNTINNNQTPQGKDSALMRLAQEIGAGMWDNTDWDDPAFQQNIKQLGITVLNKDTQPPEAFIGDAIFDHLGDTEFNAPEMNGNLLILGGLNANLPSGKIDRLYVLSDEDVRLNIGAAADVQELILGASGNVSLNGEGNVRSTIVVDKPMNLDIGIATNLMNLTDDPLPTGDIVLNPGKNALVPGQQLSMGSELKVEKKISLTVRFRLVDQSAKDMQLETADWDGALLTEATVQYTGDSCPMGAVNMLDSIEAAFAEKYPDLQEQYVLLPEMRSADPWSKVYRLNDGESCFAVAENYVYLSRTGDVVFPLTDDSTLVAEFPVYVYRYGEQDGRITYRVRINNARPEYFTPSLTLRSGAVASFTFDEERGEWVTQLKRSDFGADERDLIHLTGLRGEKTNAFLTVTGREERRIVTLTWTADTQRTTIDAQNVVWDSDRAAEGNDLLCCAGELVSVTMQPAAGYRGIHASLSDPAVSLSISEGNDAASFLMPYAPLTLTLTADKLYTVTLDASGGDPIRPIQYTVESEAFLLPTPVRTGYIFLGWTGEGITEPQKTMEIPQGSTGDRTYTANWQVIEYTVTLDVSGGDPLDPITYTVETPVILPTPTSTGYTFLGWTGEGETAPQPTVVLPKGTTGDKIYFANWEVNIYAITLDTSGGNALDAISYAVTSSPITLPTPVRTGYTFLGWTGEGIVNPQTEVIIPTGSTGNRTYTANWEATVYTIMLKNLLNGNETIPYTVEQEVKLPYPEKGGYFFEGWSGTGMTGQEYYVTIPEGTTGNREYTAHWKPTTYEIAFLMNGGEPLASISYTVESPDFDLPIPVRNGYKFVGWTSDGITVPQEIVTIHQGSMGFRMYTAHWKLQEYTVMLDVSGGDPLDPITYTVETPVILPTPTSTGYTFLGWTGEGETTPQPTVVLPKGTTGDKTYTANWKAITYTIALGANGGEELAAISYTIESDPIKLPTPERKGYEFMGWIGDDIDGAQTEVIIPTGSTGDRTYFATWRVINYIIELRQSYGDWMQNIIYTVEQEVKLPIPTREGYEFIGWVGEDIIDAQINVTIPRGSTGFRLYAAHWALENYTITLDTSGGNALNDIRYTVKSAPITLPTPTREGYTFVGWTGEGITTPQPEVIIPTGSTGNRTYTANWEIITYNIFLYKGDGSEAETIHYTVETPDFALQPPTRTGYEFLGWQRLDGYAPGEKQMNVTIPKGTTGDLTYTGCWQAIEYTITLDTSGGDALNDIRYTVKSAPITLPTPTRNGYEFSGWTGEGITTPQTEVTIPKGSTGNKAYTANWKVIEYTITLDTNGGPVVSPIKYTVEDSFTLPYPLRTGYEFAGWTLDGSGMPPFTPLIIYPGTTGNLRYKAEWRLAEYTITMDLNGGSGQEKVVYTITDEDFELPTPTRNGYEFVGWTGERITTPQTSVEIPKGSTGNRTYTANWQEQLVEPTLVPPPTIRVYCRDVDSKELLHIAVYTPSVGSEDFTLNFDSIDVTGRKFVEAHDASGNKLTSITIPQGSWGQRDYDAYFAKETYTITLDTNGGPAMSPINYTVTDSVTLRIPPDRPGYEFSGWVLDGSGQFPSTPMIIPAGSTGDRLYKAEWRVASYTITYVSHGQVINRVQYTINNRVLFSKPEKDDPGYTFAGWQIDGVPGTPLSYMLPLGSYGNRTATMLWTPVP